MNFLPEKSGIPATFWRLFQIIFKNIVKTGTCQSKFLQALGESTIVTAGTGKTIERI
jgi:hypothetical protein